MIAPAISGAGDFDFLHGTWAVEHRRLRTRLAGADDWATFDGTLTCLPTRAGLGNVDDNWLDDPAGAYGAITMRSFDPDGAAWSIWWLDLRRPRHLDPPVVGSFADGVGTFTAHDTFEGRPIVVRFRWTATGSGRPHWEQAFSADGGTTWEVNWEMAFRR